MHHFEAFANQEYLNLETFRKNGMGVKTPVWFVQDGSILYVYTIANSGKVKRIRNNGRVNVAPCKMDGVLLGEWQPADAREITDASISEKVDQLLSKKYGLMRKVFGVASLLQHRQYTVLEITAGVSDGAPHG